MKQINDRKYYEKYSDKKVVLMAVPFAAKEVMELRGYNYLNYFIKNKILILITHYKKINYLYKKFR
jgi:hypothetical protein